MNIKQPWLIMVCCLAFGLVVGVQAAESYGKQKVVYHINYDNPKQQAGALRNVQNHINAVGADRIDVKVVMHGHGVSLLLYPDALSETPKMRQANADDAMQAKVTNLKSQGVDFQVCANTLRGRKIRVDDHLYDVERSDVVPSGVAQISHLQSQGYTYLKP